MQLQQGETGNRWWTPNLRDLTPYKKEALQILESVAIEGVGDGEIEGQVPATDVPKEEAKEEEELGHSASSPVSTPEHMPSLSLSIPSNQTMINYHLPYAVLHQ